MYKFENCIFTDLPIVSSNRVEDGFEYLIKVPYGYMNIKIPMNSLEWEENEFFVKNKYIFEGLLLNNNWVDDTIQLLTLDSLKELLSQRTFPTTPKEKADNLFVELLNTQKEDGEFVEVDDEFYFNTWKKLFFRSYNELVYYSQYLFKQGLIHAHFTGGTGETMFQYYSITVEGLNYGIQLQSEGEKSNLCFIAMAFKPETSNIRNAIKEALIETGFKPILIDEQNINSDRTINDEIIANLKKCRFCIADFSYHSNGVYFESGFALGQGKKVIYTCLKSEFEKAHFDIRPLQHIIYETAEQLKIDLKHKIEAWVI